MGEACSLGKYLGFSIIDSKVTNSRFGDIVNILQMGLFLHIGCKVKANVSWQWRTLMLLRKYHFGLIIGYSSIRLVKFALL